jgi:hypothetical protein
MEVEFDEDGNLLSLSRRRCGFAYTGKMRGYIKGVLASGSDEARLTLFRGKLCDGDPVEWAFDLAVGIVSSRGDSARMNPNYVLGFEDGPGNLISYINGWIANDFDTIHDTPRRFLEEHRFTHRDNRSETSDDVSVVIERSLDPPLLSLDLDDSA